MGRVIFVQFKSIGLTDLWDLRKEKNHKNLTPFFCFHTLIDKETTGAPGSKFLKGIQLPEIFCTILKTIQTFKWQYLDSR